jgi:Tfp pilus assembly protein PilX
MRFSKLNKQNGAVLAFCLLMLLLLTLAGTRMIQQNKQQLEMANNARLSSQNFADTEGFLADAKNTINTWTQHIDLSIDSQTGQKIAINHSAHQCIPTATRYKQNVGLAGILKKDSENKPVTTILSVKCFGIVDSTTGLPKVIQECSSYNETTGKITCKSNTDCKTVDDAIAAFSDPSNDICYQDYDPQANNDNSTTIVTGKCPKEVYTIEAIATDSYGAKSQITSDHVVGCGG